MTHLHLLLLNPSSLELSSRVLCELTNLNFRGEGYKFIQYRVSILPDNTSTIYHSFSKTYRGFIGLSPVKRGRRTDDWWRDNKTR